MEEIEVIAERRSHNRDECGQDIYLTAVHCLFTTYTSTSIAHFSLLIYLKQRIIYVYSNKSRNKDVIFYLFIKKSTIID